MLELSVALLPVGFIFVRLSGEISPVLYNRDLLLIYIAAIAILCNAGHLADGLKRVPRAMTTATRQRPR